MNLRVISKEEIRRVASMAHTIDIVKQAFAQLSLGDADVPIRTQLGVARHEGVTLFMPAYLRKTDQLGIKIVSVFPRNLQAGIPTIHALVTVVDATTGRPAAVMDGTYLTALRTGAASGAATDLQAFVAEMQTRGGRIPTDIVAAPSANEAVREADIICTATTAARPVFEDADVGVGTHINAVGAYTPDTQEIPEETVQRARLFVDSREACWAEAGDLIIPRSKGLIAEGDIHAELGELVSGTKQGRSNDEEVTIFKSVGNAVQDVAVAGRVLEQAAKLGLGTEVAI
jgi:ornithine cyclodeaminase